jgi:ribosomal protein S14
MASKDKANQYCGTREGTDCRTCAGQSKKEAVMAKLDVARRMLREAKRHCIPAKHILFDNWFTNPIMEPIMEPIIGESIISNIPKFRPCLESTGE